LTVLTTKKDGKRILYKKPYMTKAELRENDRLFKEMLYYWMEDELRKRGRRDADLLP